MPSIELFDETLDINSTENYELSVQLSAEDISFSILDTVRNKYILLRSFTPESYKTFSHDNVEDIFNTDDFLLKKYSKVHVVMPSAKSTLVPSALYDPAKKEDYFSFNHVSTESSTILTNRLAGPDAWLLFAVSGPLYEIVQKHYPQSFPHHHLRTLLHQVSLSGNANGEHYIHAHVEPGFFNIVMLENGKLQLCNAFNYRNTSDILYYILNAFKSMNIRQDDAIYLSGATGKLDELSSGLSLYIRNVRFFELISPSGFSYVFNEVELHRYLNLFTAAHCE
jgi:hypothetical protein